MATPKSSWLLPCAVMLEMAVVLLELGWEHNYGGILRHHLLNHPSLPAISHAWACWCCPCSAH